MASVAIIINAVFLQSDRGTSEPEHLVTKLQQHIKPRNPNVNASSTKSTMHRPGIEIMWTRPVMAERASRCVICGNIR
jgi:hypothetical protein